MFTAEVDPSRHLVTLTTSGHVQPADFEAGAERLRELLEEVEPGFRLLADLSGIESISVATAPHIGRVMDVCNQHGVGLVIRVIPPEPHKDVGLAILSQFHYSPDVRIVTCASRAEAEAELSG